MLSKRLKEWASWGLSAEPRLVQTFTCGQNHQTALIESAGEQYVLKLFTHAFDHAINAQTWAAQQQLSPAVIYAKDNLALLEYIDGQSYKESHLTALAHTLNALHSAPPLDLNNFNLLAFCEQYLLAADRKMHQWHTALLPGLNVFISDPTPWCTCHNDLVQDNCLFQNDRTWFIDWEYAMHHNPWFDLAAVVVYFELNEQQTRSFLASYKTGWEEKFEQPIFHASQLAVLWADLLWNINKTGLDYREQYPHRFAKLESLAKVLSITLPA